MTSKLESILISEILQIVNIKETSHDELRYSHVEKCHTAMHTASRKPCMAGLSSTAYII